MPDYLRLLRFLIFDPHRFCGPFCKMDPPYCTALPTYPHRPSWLDRRPA